MSQRYQIQTPDGKTITVEGPDDATDDELIAFARQQVPQYKNNPVEVNKPAPTTGIRAADNTGAGLLSYVDNATFGLLDEAGAVVDSLGLTGGRKNIWDGSSFADAWRDNTAKNDEILRAGRAEYPVASAVGGIAGLYGPLGAAGALRLGTRAAALARAAGASSKIARGARVGAAIGTDAALSAAYGAGSNNENRGEGALVGGLAGGVGNVAGRALARPVAALARSKAALAIANVVRGAANRAIPAAAPEALSRGGQAVLAAAQKAGIPGIRSTLAEAEQLGVPMSLADTHPELRELAAAAVRRSPSASQVAEQSLLPRGRGQIDRFGQAVERDLGPIGNTLEQSNALRDQARAAAAPLYEQAYGQSVPSTPEIDAILSTPFGREAIGKARTIAANERRSPTELGFAQDAQGNAVLNPRPNDAVARHLIARDELDQAQAAYREARTVPGSMDAATARLQKAREALRSTEKALAQAPDPTAAASVPTYTMQSLDYAKRGMDDVLEQHRNPVTNRLVLNDAGRAQNQVKNQLLSEADRLNPAYREARAAFQGPMESLDALHRGQDFYGPRVSLNEAGAAVADQTPEHLAQMQLGYRDSLMNHANGVRYSSNPFDATLGTPNAEAKLAALYPDNPGVARMLQQRDLERRLAETSNAILGNSKTAQRQIADQAFGGDDTLGQFVDAGVNVAMGQIPTGLALKSLSSQGIKDAFKLGVGKRAVAKADEIAPALLAPNPAGAQDAIMRLLEADRKYRALIAASRAQVVRPLAAAGTASGAQFAR